MGVRFTVSAMPQQIALLMVACAKMCMRCACAPKELFPREWLMRAAPSRWGRRQRDLPRCDPGRN